MTYVSLLRYRSLRIRYRLGHLAQGRLKVEYGYLGFEPRTFQLGVPTTPKKKKMQQSFNFVEILQPSHVIYQSIAHKASLFFRLH